ncbi:tail fiber assembly protein [Aeromonas salmonicida]|uniref:tail fiber assembly protein n=1 Tax=Aeromonas salmonicida TaxID=645 RepID=UPI0035BF4271
MDIITAKNVVAYATQPDSLDMEVAFAHLPDQFIPFTARKDDSAAHGRELYVRAMFGEFGDIQTRVPPAYVPSEAEQQRKLDTLQADAALRIAPLQDAKELNMATPEELARLDALQRYRIALMRLPQSDGWPTEVSWPEAPL